MISKPKMLKEKLADSHYHLTKDEMETEYDMPGADMEDLRSTFFNPPQARRQKSGQT